MQAIKCEMCGGNDIIKQDGIYVCQYCGTKYSVEEAKKLLMNGTVKIDNSEKISNLYSLARRAKDQRDSKKAAQYYNEILLENPNDWEAAFYAVYFEALNCKLGEIYAECTRVKNNLNSVISIIPEQDKNNIMLDIFKDIDSLISVMHTASKNHYEQFKNVKGVEIEHYDNVGLFMMMLFDYGDRLEQRQLIQDALIAWRKGTTYFNIDLNLSYHNSNIYAHAAETMRDVVDNKIKKYDPSAKKGGCYIATSVYGSYDCPEVWVLRRFRDDVLATTLLGRAFIHTYYAISPTLVNCFGTTIWFKKTCQHPLDVLVAYLKDRGISDKAYYDK